MPSFLPKSFLLSLVCFTSTALAGNIPKTAPSTSCPGGKKHYRTSVRHIEGGGIGYSQGYTTLEGFFAPDPLQWPVMPFLDLRGHVFDGGKMAANAGIGLRGILKCRTYGINAYYDYRNTKKIHYNQVGIGLETLGKLWDFRINGYLPVGTKISAPYSAAFDRFSGHYMLMTEKFQFAMKGADAELGFHFGKSRLFDFYAAIGPYYYIGELGSGIFGGKARVAGMFKEYVTVEISDSYDHKFHNRFQGQLTVTLPFGGKVRVKKKRGCNSCNNADALTSRMVQPVGRQEIVVSASKRKTTLAIDPATGNPFFFVFVNNTSHSNGTFESPYPTLALAQMNSGPGNIIYVYPGDGTTSGMDAGITLQNNQYFWGSGISHLLQAAQGAITIPAMSSSFPQMTNTSGDGITLASNNQISGFILLGAQGNGITGLSDHNAQISTCTIENSLSDQIHLESFSGTIALQNLNLTNGGLNAIFISSATSPLACTVDSCIIQDSILASIDASFASSATVAFTNNTVNHNGAFSNFAFQGPATLLVSSNTFTNNTSNSLAPLFVTAFDSSLSATIENNTISNNTCGGIHFILNDTELAQLTIRNNTIENNGIGAIGPFGASLFIDPNGSTSGNCNLTLIDNLLIGNTGSALYCANGDFNDFQVTAIANMLTGNGGSGCLFANGCNAFTLIATNNTITDGGDHGIATAGSFTMTSASMTLSNNLIRNNTSFANGIAISHEGTDLNFVATNNEINGNSSSGILIFSSNVIENITLTIGNNTISNNQNTGTNQAGGIDIETFTNLSGSLTNNTLSNNITSGVFIGSSEPLPSICLEMVGNNSNTAYIFSSGSGVFNLTPCNVALVNTGIIIPVGPLTLVQSCPGAVPCPL